MHVFLFSSSLGLTLYGMFIRSAEGLVYIARLTRRRDIDEAVR